jgi:hypothetical protein
MRSFKLGNIRISMLLLLIEEPLLRGFALGSCVLALHSGEIVRMIAG